MLFVKICLILNVILCTFNIVCGYKNDKKKLDIDYYGRGFVKHTQVNLDCELELHKQYCRFKCSKSHAICIEGNCYCVKGNTTGLLPSRKLHKPEDIPSKETTEEDYFLDGHPWNINHKPKIPNSRPIRRHHIAHFCVNLDEARKCIRKCMLQGKPAFCGKDHVCYCGHKYKTPGNMFNKKINVSAMYIQFQDLYDKYFGTKDKTEEVKDNENYNNDIVTAALKENYDSKNNVKENAGYNVGRGTGVAAGGPARDNTGGIASRIYKPRNDVNTNAEAAEETGGDAGDKKHGDGDAGDEKHGDGDAEDDKDGYGDAEDEKHGDVNSGDDKDGDGDAEDEKHGNGDAEDDKDGYGDAEDEKHGDGNSGDDKDGDGDAEDEKHGNGDAEDDKDGDGDAEDEKHGDGNSGDDKDGDGGAEDEKHGDGDAGDDKHGDGYTEGIKNGGDQTDIAEADERLRIGRNLKKMIKKIIMNI